MHYHSTDLRYITSTSFTYTVNRVFTEITISLKTSLRFHCYSPIYVVDICIVRSKHKIDLTNPRLEVLYIHVTP